MPGLLLGGCGGTPRRRTEPPGLGAALTGLCLGGGGDQVAGDGDGDDDGGGGGGGGSSMAAAGRRRARWPPRTARRSPAEPRSRTGAGTGGTRPGGTRPEAPALR